ncbi:MAG: UvrD-helicase domain-containing protein [Rickettsiales bacterium]|nr:UvrD-helicase domain-containing protein [Rickettsiales bacterium]
MLENLNKEQRAAVESAAAGGPVLILAGAGTGKTTALTALIATIFPNPAENVLAVTFTNKAAKEIKDRIFKINGRIPYWCGTFHSICLKILRREKQAMGVRSDFLVFGEDEQKKVLKSVLADLCIDSDDYDPSKWVEIIAFYKDTGKKNSNEKFAVILDAYNAELKRLNAVDFADIINHTNSLLTEHPDILAKYQELFRYVLVDEFQDTNAPQYALLKLLSAKHQNICCVGDDDQSIYSWRGAQIGNILNFEKDFKDARIFRLTQNYRSTRHILNAANSMIKNNHGRLGKDLWSGLGDGQKVRVATFYSEFDEARSIAEVIENDKVRNMSDFAILIRNGSLSKKFEDEFIARQIPYKLVGAQKFYDRMEIQDVIAYLRLLVHRFDDLSFLRVISKPRRGLGEQAINELKSYSSRACVRLFESLQNVTLKPKQRANADEFIHAFDFDWMSLSPVDSALKLIENAGYLKMWKESKDDSAEDRVRNIYELINGTVSKYDSLDEFLENASLMVADDGAADKLDEQSDAVGIMTIHAVKGLEYDTVFMPAWEEGIFPNDRAVNNGGLEEERRLAYVAITRAKNRAVISHAISRTVFGSRQNNPPSRFIGEIDKEFIETDGARDTGREIRKKNSSYPSRFISCAVPARIGMIGKLVHHSDLGSGVVIEENGDILMVAFKDKGIKKVDKKFVIS